MFWDWILIIAALLLLGWLYSGLSSADADNEEGVKEARPGLYAHLLRQAGLRGGKASLWAFWGSKFFCAAIVALGLLLWLDPDPEAGRPIAMPFLAGTCILGFLLPDLWLMHARQVRRRRIQRSLSFFFDLVVSLLRASLPLDRAVFRAGRDAFWEPHPLAEELEQLEHELQAGKDREKAYFSLADRTGVQELRSFAGALRLGTRQGSPVVDTLSAQADALRLRRRDEAYKRVQVASAISVFPMFLIGVPVFVVIVYFPAFVEVLETLRSLRLFD